MRERADHYFDAGQWERACTYAEALPLCGLLAEGHNCCRIICVGQLVCKHLQWDTPTGSNW